MPVGNLPRSSRRQRRVPRAVRNWRRAHSCARVPSVPFAPTKRQRPPALRAIGDLDAADRARALARRRRGAAALVGRVAAQVDAPRAQARALAAEDRARPLLVGAQRQRAVVVAQRVQAAGHVGGEDVVLVGDHVPDLGAPEREVREEAPEQPGQRRLAQQRARAVVVGHDEAELLRALALARERGRRVEHVDAAVVVREVDPVADDLLVVRRERQRAARAPGGVRPRRDERVLGGLAQRRVGRVRLLGRLLVVRRAELGEVRRVDDPQRAGLVAVADEVAAALRLVVGAHLAPCRSASPSRA